MRRNRVAASDIAASINAVIPNVRIDGARQDVAFRPFTSGLSEGCRCLTPLGSAASPQS